MSFVKSRQFCVKQVDSLLLAAKDVLGALISSGYVGKYSRMFENRKFRFNINTHPDKSVTTISPWRRLVVDDVITSCFYSYS